ncbi:psbP domain-containing chloroplastic [Micractinium conductrix]|uniref:PsbP domain-containing chloroplastic n=1 Tax=Micractinium conductrix TaxID=554055 RepID=A0A2P6VH42_9CHLO|nr:psbP domain-containing chloroplastic [Micractinium conductrix]|eukprot:PSC73402.1 psbP domain-containing chloroplastic [Micractinium conductrix]
MIDNSGCMSQRRGLLLGLGSVLLAAGAAPLQGAAAAEQQAEAAASSSSDELVAFSNPAQRYTLLRPAGWEQVGKAGADALFRDPAQKSTNVGVTVYPVTVSSLEAFGDLPTVGERLLGAEKEKESTLSAVMVEQRARTDPAGGFSIYDFEYELESTRGRKRILSTVTIAGRKLYIANGNLSCGKADSCAAAEGALPLLRAVTQSLTVKP